MVAATSKGKKGTRYSKLTYQQQKPGDTAAASARSLAFLDPARGRASSNDLTCPRAVISGRAAHRSCGSEIRKYARAQHSRGNRPPVCVWRRGPFGGRIFTGGLVHFSKLLRGRPSFWDLSLFLSCFCNNHIASSNTSMTPVGHAEHITGFRYIKMFRGCIVASETKRLRASESLREAKKNSPPKDLLM